MPVWVCGWMWVIETSLLNKKSGICSRFGTKTFAVNRNLQQIRWMPEFFCSTLTTEMTKNVISWIIMVFLKIGVSQNEWFSLMKTERFVASAEIINCFSTCQVRVVRCYQSCCPPPSPPPPSPPPPVSPRPWLHQLPPPLPPCQLFAKLFANFRAQCTLLNLNLGPSQLSAHRWTSTWDLPSSVRTAGPQPGTFPAQCAPLDLNLGPSELSGHRWTSTWDLPSSVRTAGPQRPDRMPEDMPDRMSDRMPEDMPD